MISVSLSLRGNLLSPNTQQVEKRTYYYIFFNYFDKKFIRHLKMYKGMCSFPLFEEKPLKAAAVKGLQCKVVQPGPTNSGL